jgi:hypothetical protein
MIDSKPCFKTPRVSSNRKVTDTRRTPPLDGPNFMEWEAIITMRTPVRWHTAQALVSLKYTDDQHGKSG